MLTVENLKFQNHKIFKGAKRARIEYSNGAWISIICGFGTYGDGDSTFEVATSESEIIEPEIMYRRQLNKLIERFDRLHGNGNQVLV